MALSSCLRTDGLITGKNVGSISKDLPTCIHMHLQLDESKNRGKGGKKKKKGERRGKRRKPKRDPHRSCEDWMNLVRGKKKGKKVGKKKTQERLHHSWEVQMKSLQQLGYRECCLAQPTPAFIH